MVHMFFGPNAELVETLHFTQHLEAGEHHGVLVLVKLKYIILSRLSAV